MSTVTVANGTGENVYVTKSRCIFQGENGYKNKHIFLTQCLTFLPQPTKPVVYLQQRSLSTELSLKETVT